MPDDETHGWDLTALGRRHRVEITGSFSRTISWYVDGQLVSAKTASEDSIQLKPGELPKESNRTAEAPSTQMLDVGVVGVRFTALGRPKRVTWYQAEGGVSAAARALLGSGGIDLDPEAGSPAALREERIRRHPRRHAATAVALGAGKVVAPILLGLLIVRLTVAIPWPDWNLPSTPWPNIDLPSIPWPNIDLPSIPWPDVNLPDWMLPDWMRWLAHKLQYIWPVILAAFLARREIKRRREQDALKARLKAEAQSTGSPPTSPAVLVPRTPAPRQQHREPPGED